MLFEGLTEQKFNALKSDLVASHKAEVTGDTEGSITAPGFTANYSYQAQTLTIDVVHHPFFVPVSMIEKRLREKIDLL